jgi:hypothetical protein
LWMPIHLGDRVGRIGSLFGVKSASQVIDYGSPGCDLPQHLANGKPRHAEEETRGLDRLAVMCEVQFAKFDRKRNTDRVLSRSKVHNLNGWVESKVQPLITRRYQRDGLKGAHCPSVGAKVVGGARRPRPWIGNVALLASPACLRRRGIRCGSPGVGVQASPRPGATGGR